MKLLPFITVLISALFFTLCAHASDLAQFSITKPSGAPLAKAKIYIYNGDMQFKLAPGQVAYPYSNEGKTKSWYVGEIITDGKGDFDLNMQDFQPRNLILVAGSVFNPITIRKSSDLSYTPSADDIRVVEFAEGSSLVVANHIYNWRAHTVVDIPMGGAPSAEKPADRIALRVDYKQKQAPFTPDLEPEKVGMLMQPIESLTYRQSLLPDVHKAITGDDLSLRAYAATYLGRYGTAASVPYLIDALSDESVHVDADDKDPGMATTRYRAALALRELTGENFGFVWNGPQDERDAAIYRWKDWLNERNIIIERVKKYLKETGHGDYYIYRIHLNKAKTAWSASLRKKQQQSGMSALSIDRKTLSVSVVAGQ